MDIKSVNEVIVTDEGNDASQNNHAPVLEKIGDKVVAVYDTLEITLTASDLDGDKLFFSVYGDIPQDAKFLKDEKKFIWTPSKSNITVYLTFVVSDGTSIDRETIAIKVVDQDAGQPPEFVKISDQVLKAGVPYSLKLAATDPNGDELTYGISGQKPEKAELDEKLGLFTWTPEIPLEGSVVSVRFTVTDGTYNDEMDVKFIIGKGSSPPVFEKISDKTVKPGEKIEFEVKADDPDEEDTVEITVSSKLPEGSSFHDSTHVFSWIPAETQSGKNFSVTFTASDGKFTSYMTVKISVSSSQTTKTCKDDQFEPNTDVSQAKEINAGIYENLSICDTEQNPVDMDWFRVHLNKGETISVKITFIHAQGDIDTDLSLDGSEETIVAKSYGSTDIEAFSYESPKESDYILLVFGSGGEKFSNIYTLEIEIDGNVSGCDAKSCKKYYVCDFDAKECVMDYCEEKTDCPKQYECIDTFCINSCSSDSDCRPEYACKSFGEGNFCGVTGNNKTGEACNSFASCDDKMVCIFIEKGGYCTAVNCIDSYDCPLDSWCIFFSSMNICAKECKTNDQCRKSDGYSCKKMISLEEEDVNVCVF